MSAPTAVPAASGAASPLLAAAVVVHDRETDRVVLLRRGPGAAFGAGQWDLPVGKSEPGEPVTETAVRELREETELAVAPAALRLGQVVHGARSPHGGDGFLTVVFLTHSWSGELVNAEPEKHSQVCWVPAGALPADMVLSAGLTLAGALRGEPAVRTIGWAEAPLSTEPGTSRVR